jgi:hypothetical protein
MIFKDTHKEAQFEKEGYTLLPNFLNQNQLEEIDKLYLELGIDSLGEIYSNVKDKDTEFNEKIDKTLTQIYSPSLNQIFVNYKPGGGAFLIKGTGEKSVSSLHQDWNVVDESKYQSMCVFCPLIDVDETNGCIQIVKGTHKWFNSLRSINMPSLFVNFEDVKDLLIAVPAKRGDAVVFAHNVFHGSLPNFTNQIRPAASVSVISQEAQLVHYYRQNDKIDLVDATHFFNESVHQIMQNIPQELHKIKSIDYKESYNLNHQDFKKKYKQKNSFLNRWIN